MLSLAAAAGCALSPVAMKSNILILDHYNYNHRKGDHGVLKEFFFDLLGMTPDPHKAENIAAGKGTVWANCGAHQFHLAEGKPDPQVLDGCITLRYRSLTVSASLLVECRLHLASKFSATEMNGALALTDPWGSPFRLVEGVDDDAYNRQENGEDAEARCILDLTLHLPSVTTPSRLAGLGRFYEQILGCEVTNLEEQRCVIATGGPRRADGSPMQTLTYLVCDRADVSHDDLDVDEEGDRSIAAHTSRSTWKTFAARTAARTSWGSCMSTTASSDALTTRRRRSSSACSAPWM